MGTSTSRVSLMGLPLSIDSSTASSRERSWVVRAMRYRYLARSVAGRRAQARCARRAAMTAASTSAGPAAATSASTSSVAGFTVLKVEPSRGATNWPQMNKPYDASMLTRSRASGAGAYSHVGVTRSGTELISVERHVVGPVVATAELLVPLHEEVVEE